MNYLQISIPILLRYNSINLIIRKYHSLTSPPVVIHAQLKSACTNLNYRNYPKYSDTVNVRTRYFFLKRHLFYVPYISGHVPNGIFADHKCLDTKNRSLISHKTFIFTTEIFWQFALFTCVSGSETDNPLCPVCVQ